MANKERRRYSEATVERMANELADARAEIERLRKDNDFLRTQRESLERQLAHYRGYGV